MGVRVLVLDVEPAVRMLVSYALADEGVDVEQAASAREAIALLHARRFDAVFVDRRVPDCSAEQFADLARGAQPGLPVILTSGEPQHLSRMSSSLDAYVNKPFKLSALSSALEQAIARRRPAARVG